MLEGIKEIMSKVLSGLEKKIAGKADFEAYEKHMHPDNQELLIDELEEIINGDASSIDKHPGAATKAYQELYSISKDKKDEIKTKKHAEQIVAEYARYFLQKVRPGIVEKIDEIEDEEDRLEALLNEFDHFSGIKNSKLRSVRAIIQGMHKDKKAKKYIRALNSTVKENYINSLNERNFNKHIPETMRIEYADFLRQKLEKKGFVEAKKNELYSHAHEQLRQLHHDVLSEAPKFDQYGLKPKKEK